MTKCCVSVCAHVGCLIHQTSYPIIALQAAGMYGEDLIGECKMAIGYLFAEAIHHFRGIDDIKRYIISVVELIHEGDEFCVPLTEAAEVPVVK